MAYEPSPRALRYAQQGDTQNARTMLHSALRENPENTDNAVGGLRDFFAGRLDNLFEVHNSELYPITEDHAEWTQDYWETVLAQLMENFSRERFEHASKVGKSYEMTVQTKKKSLSKPSAKKTGGAGQRAAKKAKNTRPTSVNKKKKKTRSASVNNEKHDSCPPEQSPLGGKIISMFVQKVARVFRKCEEISDESGKPKK